MVFFVNTIDDILLLPSYVLLFPNECLHIPQIDVIVMIFVCSVAAYGHLR